MNVIDGQAGRVRYYSLIFYSLTINNILNIILLLILAGISISALTNTGIFQKAKDAKVKNEKAQAQEEITTALNYLIIENETSTSTLTQEEKRKILEDELKKSTKASTVIINENGYKVNHRKYNFYIDENLKLIEDEKEFDTTEWDKTAAPEDIFIWGSNDPNNSEYGTVVGYTDSVDNYTVLRYPSRCTKLETDDDKYTFYNDRVDPYNRTFLGSRDITGNIKKVELPETLVEIGSSSFGDESQGGYNFSSLKSLDLPNKLRYIREDAFKYCNIESITIPESVTCIENDAFFGCSITNITLLCDVKGIQYNAFSGCSELKTIYRNIKYIGTVGQEPWGAGSTWNKTEVKIDLKDPMTETEKAEWDKNAAPEDAFIWKSDDSKSEDYRTIIGYKKGIDNYTVLRYPSRCKKITATTYQNEASRSYTSNIKKIEIPITVTDIGEKAFSKDIYFFDSLEDIIFPESVLYISENIVSNLNNLKSITISSSPRKIDANAFSNCPNLKNININKERSQTKNSPWGAEQATIKWKELMSEEEKKEWDKNAAPEDAFVWESDDPNSTDYGTIKYRKEQVQNYTILRFPSRCTKIECLGTYYHELNDRNFVKNIIKVELPKTVVEINSGAFASNLGGGYENLREINIPENVIKIDGIFSGCTNLTIYVNQNFNVINGAPWGASNSEVKWKSEN